MKKEDAGDLINEVFNIHISEKDYEEEIQNVMQWDSFLMITLLQEMERKGRKREIEKLFELKTVKDLIHFVSGEESDEIY